MTQDATHTCGVFFPLCCSKAAIHVHVFYSTHVLRMLTLIEIKPKPPALAVITVIYILCNIYKTDVFQQTPTTVGSKITLLIPGGRDFDNISQIAFPGHGPHLMFSRSYERIPCIVVYYLYHTIVVCLSTTRGINDKSRVDVRLAVL